MNSVEKGRVAEARVLSELVSSGHEVFVPAFGNARCDLVYLDRSGLPRRVEVKYAARIRASGSVEVHLRQIRANRSQMKVGKFQARNSDILAVYAAPFDAVAFVTATYVEGKSTIHLAAHQCGQGIDHPIGDGTPLEPGRACEGLGGSTPSLSAS